MTPSFPQKFWTTPRNPQLMAVLTLIGVIVVSMAVIALANWLLLSYFGPVLQ